MAGFNLADLFEIVARAVPERTAVRSGGRGLSFAELDARATGLASGLAARGIGRGDTVGLYLTNGPEYLEAFLAACKLGAIPFNVNYRYRGEELRYLFDNAKAAVVFHDRAFTPEVEALRPALPALRLSVAVEDGSGAAIGGSVAYEGLVAHSPGGPWPRDDSDLVILYTGGTTGMPKGVMWPHRAFLFACLGGGGYFHPAGPIAAPEDIARRAAEGPPLTIYPLAPLMHGAAMWATFSALLGGLTVLLERSPRFDPEAVWDTVAAERANLVQIVGDAMAGPLVEALHGNPGRWELGHVVNVGSGGALFSQHHKDALRELLPNISVTDGMGTSETGISGMAEASADGLMRLPAGPSQRIVVDGRLGEPGETGYLARTGDTPVGYWGDAAKTAETFVTIDGELWAVTGDRARHDPDGRLTLFGRGSTCINSGGEKIFPEEVEAALRAHPEVADAVVVGQPDPRWGERVVAVVAARRASEPPALEPLREFVKGRLADYKLPKALVVVDEIVRSPAGKPDYRWAREVADAG